MTEAEHQREDRDYESQLDRREALEREDICSLVAGAWRRAVRIAYEPVAIEEEAA